MTAVDVTQAEIHVESVRTALQRHQQNMLASLLVVGWMVEARDPYPGGHQWRVSQFAKSLAGTAGLPEPEVQRIAMAGSLHDLGKIGIPDAIPGKPGRLTDDEYEVIKSHSRIGSRMLAGHPLASLVEAAVLMHHEMPNGKGYLLGLAGNQLACWSCRGAFEQRSDDQAVFLERKATASELDVVPDRHLINTLVPGWAGNCQLSALA